jgi:hypothetical protein
MSKAKKPAPEVVLKSDKREAEARARFQAIGGLGNTKVQAISLFFSTYHQDPQPGRLIEVARVIDACGLMLLPEHRNGVAGGLAGVLGIPEHEPDDPLLRAALRLAPPEQDEQVTRAGQVEYLWMHWIVTRRPAERERIIRLAHRQDAVGEQALAFLRIHAEMPEVARALHAALSRRQQAVSTAIPPGVPVEDVHALKEHLLAASPLNFSQILFVAWLPGDEGGFVVTTQNGASPIGCPKAWRQRQVLVKKAQPQELAAYRALLDAAEEP